MQSGYRLPCLKKVFALMITLCVLSSQTSCVRAQDDLRQASDLLQSAGLDLSAKKYEAAAKKALEAAALVETSGRIQQTAAEALFLAGKPKESLPLFDRANALLSENAPHNWQRGIALGCCGKWEEGAKQFKQHQDVNPDDVENSAWYFLCVAKSDGVAAAKASVIPSRGDPRQPMMAVLQMLMGEKKPEEVLVAAVSGTPEGPRRKQALFYGELYVGLYYDSIGNGAEAEKHLRASLNHDQSNYMADTARVYLQHRFPNPNNPSKPTAK